MADTVTAYGPEWLQFVKEQFFKDDEVGFATYKDSYEDKPYSKGSLPRAVMVKQHIMTSNCFQQVWLVV